MGRQAAGKEIHMQLKLNDLASMEQRTWSWTGANGTVIDEWVPAIQPYTHLPAVEYPKGVDGLLAAPEEIQQLETGLGPVAQRFVQQHQNAGEYLLAKTGSRSTKVLEYIYTLDENSPTLVDDNVIVAEAGSELFVFQAVLTADEAPCLHAGRTRILAHEGAKVKLVQLQMMNGRSVHWYDVGAQVGPGAKVEVVQMELGAQRSLAGCHMTLAGEKAEGAIDAAYFAHEKREIDLSHMVRHLAPDTQSGIQVRGAMFGHSKKNYRGTLDFVPGAARSVGHEAENVLMFSPHVRNLSTPVILCGEEDVEGMHAASIGQVDKDKMFYLLSRGLSEAEAKRLLLDAQFAPALAAIPNEEIRRQVTAYFEERMRNV